MVSAAARRRLRASSSGFLKRMSSKISSGLGNWRWTMMLRYLGVRAVLIGSFEG